MHRDSDPIAAPPSLEWWRRNDCVKVVSTVQLPSSVSNLGPAGAPSGAFRDPAGGLALLAMCSNSCWVVLCFLRHGNLGIWHLRRCKLRRCSRGRYLSDSLPAAPPFSPHAADVADCGRYGNSRPAGPQRARHRGRPFTQPSIKRARPIALRRTRGCADRYQRSGVVIPGQLVSVDSGHGPAGVCDRYHVRADARVRALYGVQVVGGSTTFLAGSPALFAFTTRRIFVAITPGTIATRRTTSAIPSWRHPSRDG